jgi:hypothetical protein
MHAEIKRAYKDKGNDVLSEPVISLSFKGANFIK